MPPHRIERVITLTFPILIKRDDEGNDRFLSTSRSNLWRLFIAAAAAVVEVRVAAPPKAASPKAAAALAETAAAAAASGCGLLNKKAEASPD